MQPIVFPMAQRSWKMLAAQLPWSEALRGPVGSEELIPLQSRLSGNFTMDEKKTRAGPGR